MAQGHAKLPRGSRLILKVADLKSGICTVMTIAKGVRREEEVCLAMSGRRMPF